MSDNVYSNWIPESALQELLANPPQDLAYMILEAVDKVSCGSFRRPLDLIHYGTGRAFGPTLEIRWQRDGDQFHTLILGNITQPPITVGQHQELATSDFDREENEYFLWGEWSDNIPQWVEASIPHIFDYPEPQSQGTFRRKLKVVEYVNRITGEMEFYRFADLREERI